MKINKISTKVANFINKSPKTQNFLINIAENPANFSNKFNCGVNGFLRPVASIAIATDKMDGIYGSSSSVCSSIVELITGNTILKPIKKAIDTSAENLEGFGIYAHNGAIDRYKSVTNRLSKLSLIPINTIAKYSIVAPMAGLMKKGLKKIDKRFDING